MITEIAAVKGNQSYSTLVNIYPNQVWAALIQGEVLLNVSAAISTSSAMTLPLDG